MISLVVAHGENRVIGKDGWMPWNLPEDLKHFKKVTLHHTILMGRTTFDAMKRPLPKRHTIVVTTNPEYRYDHENVSIVHDLPATLAKWKETDNVLYVCGGAKIYAQALPYVDEMWISLVAGDYDGDTFFPEYDTNDFIVVSKEAKAGFLIIHYRKKP